MKLALTALVSFVLALGLLATASAANPDVYNPGHQPCSLSGVSYAAPSAGYVSYSQSVTGCTYSPWGARLEAYFWDGGWWQIIVHDPTNAYYSRTLYSAAVEGWHQNFFPWVSPYNRYGHTYAP